MLNRRLEGTVSYDCIAVPAAAAQAALPLLLRLNRLFIVANKVSGRTRSISPGWLWNVTRLGGARLVLADQVGLGKTVQLAMAALLMALDEPAGGPILVLAPKPLLQQWQDELMELLLLSMKELLSRGW